MSRLVVAFFFEQLGAQDICGCQNQRFDALEFLEDYLRDRTANKNYDYPVYLQEAPSFVRGKHYDTIKELRRRAGKSLSDESFEKVTYLTRLLRNALNDVD